MATLYSQWLQRYKFNEVEPVKCHPPDPFALGREVIRRNHMDSNLRAVVERILRDPAFDIYRKIQQIYSAEDRHKLSKLVKGTCVYVDAPHHVRYQYLGRGKGAGMHRKQEMEIYHDPVEGQVYFRGLMDFQNRMKPI